MRHRLLAARRWPLRSAFVPSLFALGLLAALAVPAAAQPFGGSFSLSATNPGYAAIPDSPALDPTNAITIELWVSDSDADSQCRSLVGKDYLHAYWVGICGRTLRTYLQGSTSVFNGGTIPQGELTHIAVTYDGATRRHYINGELVASKAETGLLTTTTQELRIGSDVSWNFTPTASFSEVRLWNVARTQDQIRSTINVRLIAPQTGLVAAWVLGATDDLHNHNGTVVGHSTVLDLPIAADCGGGDSTFLCLDHRFAISAMFRAGAPGTAESPAQTVGFTSTGSGLFWFFSADNWEVMVKAIDGCALNSRYWIYSAATTDVFYRMTVYDVNAGAQKIYFNYPGPPAPAVTDSDAFATCP
jgi:hypothetical protein